MWEMREEEDGFEKGRKSLIYRKREDRGSRGKRKDSCNDDGY